MPDDEAMTAGVGASVPQDCVDDAAHDGVGHGLSGLRVDALGEQPRLNSAERVVLDGPETG